MAAGISPKNKRKNNIRRNIQNNMQSIKNKFIRKGRNNNFTPLILIQGDIQDTITRTAKDNVSTSGSKTQHPLGILAWFNKNENKNQEFTSVVYRHTPEGK